MEVNIDEYNELNGLPDNKGKDILIPFTNLLLRGLQGEKITKNRPSLFVELFSHVSSGVRGD